MKKELKIKVYTPTDKDLWKMIFVSLFFILLVNMFWMSVALLKNDATFWTFKRSKCLNCSVLFFHRNIVCFRPKGEEMVDIIIACVTFGALAVMILIVWIFFRTKYGKNVCKKHFRKGNSYLKLHGSIFWLLQYQIFFLYEPII